jgi:nucleoside-diphosphate-sugar epimerase
MELYLVTGGAGFIGSNIAHELVRRGEKVRILDNFSTGSIKNISHIIEDVEIIEADIRDLYDVKKAIEGVDYVLHQAALPSVARSIDNPIISNNVNGNGTLNLLTASRDASVKRFIFAASSSVYGDTPVLPKKEDMPLNPLSPYAISKMIGEQYCRIFYQLYGLETVSLRYFNVFGPKQDPSSQYSAVIPKFITEILDDRPIVICGDGEQSRDFTYVKNVVDANLLACKALDAPGTVINIACGCQISLNQLISAIEHELGISAKREYISSRSGDIKHSCADITKAKMLLGYKPKVDFYKGLEETVKWYANSRRILTPELSLRGENL